MSVYCIYSYWSPYVDGEVMRVSMTNDRGDEVFKIVPRPRGSEYRRVRDEVLDEIEQAIRSGAEPGEIP